MCWVSSYIEIVCERGKVRMSLIYVKRYLVHGCFYYLPEEKQITSQGMFIAEIISDIEFHQAFFIFNDLPIIS